MNQTELPECEKINKKEPSKDVQMTQKQAERLVEHLKNIFMYVRVLRPDEIGDFIIDEENGKLCECYAVWNKAMPCLNCISEKALREEVPIAVCSNKPHEAAIHVVESVYGPGFFNRIQGQTAEIPRKPSPIGALAIADALGARPEECLYFGDTNTDMQTGNAAGMFTVGVTWGFRPRQELIDNHAMELLDRPEEILTLFHRKNQEK